jgi:hypothetical protein
MLYNVHSPRFFAVGLFGSNPTLLSRKLPQVGYADSRKTQREVWMVYIPALIAEWVGGKGVGLTRAKVWDSAKHYNALRDTLPLPWSVTLYNLSYENNCI